MAEEQGEVMVERLRPAIHPTYSRLLCAHLHGQGFDDADIFAGTRLEWQQLLSEHRYLSQEQLTRLIRRAVALTGQPWIGLNIASAISVSAHGALGYAVVSAPDLRALHQVVARYASVRLQLTALAFVETGPEGSEGGEDKEGRLIITERQPLGETREFLYGSLLGTYFQMLDAVSPQRIRDIQVLLPLPRPAWAQEYEQQLGCRVAFGTEKFEVVIPGHYLDRRCLTADPAMHRTAVRDCEHQRKQLEHGGPFSRQVGLLLLDKPGAFPTLETMASAFAMSPRTLIRKLKAEDTSYQQLLDDVRRELGCWLLMETGDSVERIAEQLGYQDTSNFSRTFRRWFGITPLAMRKDGGQGSGRR